MELNNDNYTRIFGILPLGIILLDSMGAVKYANSKAAALLGKNSADFMGKYLEDICEFYNSDNSLLYPSDLPFRKPLETRLPIENLELKLKDRNGEYLSLIFNSYALIDESGKVSGGAVIISEQSKDADFQKKLAESEDRFRKAFHLNPDSINLNRLSDGLYIDINDGFTELTGYTRAETIGRGSLDIDIWANPADRTRLIGELKEKGNVRDFIADFRLKDGRIRKGSMFASIVEISGEKFILSVTKDIHDQYNLESSLRERESTLQSIFQAAPIGIGLTKNRILGWANYRISEMTGYSLEELYGQSARILYPSEEEFLRVGRIKYPEILLGKIGTIETVWKKKDGSLIEIILSSVAINYNDLSQGVVYTALDITELKKTLSALRESETNFRNIIEQSNDGVYILHNGRFVIVNRNFLDLFELTKEEVESDNFDFMSIVSPDSQSLFTEKIENIYHSGSHHRFEFVGSTKSGKNIELEVSINVIPYKNETAIQGFIRDISHQKKMEQQLKQALKMEAMGRFAGGIAHDFNNHLTAILGDCSMAALNIGNPEALKSDLDDIETTAKRAAELVKQLLLFSKKQAAVLSKIEINSVITNFQRMLRRILTEDIELNLLLSNQPCVIQADSGQIEQIIMNIVINSKDALTHGGIIEISTGVIVINGISEGYLKLKPGSYVELKISDNGPGIPADTKEHIFEPFYTTKGMGTGLGLSTVYAIIESLGGHVEVISEAGSGTVFRILLPQYAGAPNHKVKSDETIIPRGNERILIVEDDIHVRETAAKVLRKLDYSVFEASSASQALNLCYTAVLPFDLVLTDIIMPGIDGVEFTRLIRDRWPQIKFLLMSGYSREGVLAEKGIDMNLPFLAKPFSPYKLAIKIREVLDL